MAIASAEPIRRFYAGWNVYNDQMVTVVGDLTPSQLEVRPAAGRWPLWATIGHTAGMRVYWLCGVLQEPGADATPFADPLSEIGWEDDLDTPRTADDLVEALETTWQIIDGCLQRWSIAMIDEVFRRPGTRQPHSRQSVLMRLISHDAYHCGEISQTLGIHGLPQIDLWPPPRT